MMLSRGICVCCHLFLSPICSQFFSFSISQALYITYWKGTQVKNIIFSSSCFPSDVSLFSFFCAFRTKFPWPRFNVHNFFFSNLPQIFMIHITSRIWSHFEEACITINLFTVKSSLAQLFSQMSWLLSKKFLNFLLQNFVRNKIQITLRFLIEQTSISSANVFHFNH